ncbi:hypothetical protein LCGC14_1613420 [marine sediment metagenome]|uniref:Uncharacterized protein n=1 Tax=marine sediment metagenome TaxID=412755 RepID=A0A0F9KNA8_9ZZZZ
MEEERKQVEEVVEEKETEQALPGFEKQLDTAFEQNIEHFYKDVLTKANERIQIQGTQIKALTEQQVIFRDEIALVCYVPLISEMSEYKIAAHEAYNAADAFLRAREGVELQQVLVVNPTIE